MASGNSRTRSSISPVWLDCCIRVYLNFTLRKHEKLNKLLPQFFCVYISGHLTDTYSSFSVIAGGEIFFGIVMFSEFFFCATGYVYSMSSLTLSNSSTKLAGNQISRHESYRIFLGCIRCCAIASHNLLSRYIKTNIKSTSAFCKGNICRTVDSFIILIKTDRVRRKTILVQGRLVFFLRKII